MKLCVKQSDFAQALATVARAVATRPTLPVLSHVLLQAEGSHLLMAGTDLEIFITTKIHVQRIDKEGAFTVPAKLLLDFVKALPDEPIEIELHEDTSLQLVCGKNDADIKGIPAQEFPMLPEHPDAPQYYLDAPMLKQALGQVVFTAAEDESRPVLTGVYFGLERDKLTLAAADGFRLSVTSIEQAVETPQSAIVPAKALAELIKLLPNNDDLDETPACQFSILDSRVHFVIAGFSMDAQLIQGNFVNYQQIIPKSHSIKALVDVALLLSVLKTANIIARSADGLVNLDIGTDRIGISTSAVDTGEYDASVHATVDGKSLTIALNVQYLMQAVQAVDAEFVTMLFNDKAQPVKLESGDFVHVIMPMHVRE